jgi:hypothetical protein
MRAFELSCIRELEVPLVLVLPLVLVPPLIDVPLVLEPLVPPVVPVLVPLVPPVLVLPLIAPVLEPLLMLPVVSVDAGATAPPALDVSVVFALFRPLHAATATAAARIAMRFIQSSGENYP